MNDLYLQIRWNLLKVGGGGGWKRILNEKHFIRLKKVTILFGPLRAWRLIGFHSCLFLNTWLWYHICLTICGLLAWSQCHKQIQLSITILLLNYALWSVWTSHMNCNIVSECFISYQLLYSETFVWHRLLHQRFSIRMESLHYEFYCGPGTLNQSLWLAQFVLLCKLL